MTTYQPPRWLNPEVLTARTDDRRDRQFASISRAVDDFVATHQQTCTEAHAASNNPPDEVYTVVDEWTGYKRIFDDMHALSDRLDDLANGKLVGIGLDNEGGER